jgi:hypothetical protein
VKAFLLSDRSQEDTLFTVELLLLLSEYDSKMKMFRERLVASNNGGSGTNNNNKCSDSDSSGGGGCNNNSSKHNCSSSSTSFLIDDILFQRPKVCSQIFHFILPYGHLHI